MRRLQIMIDEDLDDALERLSVERSTSKAELIRQFVRAAITSVPPLERDPICRMIGVDDREPAPIDDVVYR